MSTDSKKSFTPTPSQGDFWGGHMATYGLYAALAILPTGFLGMDHLALRSPTTAFLKFLVNVFFCGAWYFYDIFQIVSKQERFLSGKYGFSTPFGPSGHGYNMLKGLVNDSLINTIAEKKGVKPEDIKINEMGPSPYYGGIIKTVVYVLYGVLLWIIGFTGIPSMLVGDGLGGLITLLTCWLFPLYMIMSVVQFFNMGTIEKEGVSRFWPVVHPGLMLMEKHPAVRIIESGLAKKEQEKYNLIVKAKEEKGEQIGIVAAMTSVEKGFLSFIEKFGNVFGPIGIFNVATKAKGAFESFTKAFTKVVDKNPDAVVEAVLTGKAVPPIPTLDPAKPLAAAVPKPPTGLSSSAVTVTDAVSKPTQMVGGGIELTGTSDLDYIILMGIGILAVGGFAAAFYHKFIPSEKKEENESPPKADTRDDAPPVPGRV